MNLPSSRKTGTALAIRRHYGRQPSLRQSLPWLFIAQYEVTLPIGNKSSVADSNLPYIDKNQKRAMRRPFQSTSPLHSQRQKANSGVFSKPGNLRTEALKAKRSEWRPCSRTKMR